MIDIALLVLGGVIVIALSLSICVIVDGHKVSRVLARSSHPSSYANRLEPSKESE